MLICLSAGRQKADTLVGQGRLEYAIDRRWQLLQRSDNYEILKQFFFILLYPNLFLNEFGFPVVVLG